MVAPHFARMLEIHEVARPFRYDLRSLDSAIVTSEANAEGSFCCPGALGVRSYKHAGVQWYVQ
jgi:hypothetical protein